ncbi:glycosyltransferase family 39 protein [filamentous cyanobacterium LEGE 11480]|uniref:Glycosyltransferase family 39 protein n=1 Tax=Romeriopsis navalis LEGE 11480 TaxID=2777977 RepID=A0A928Z2B5_9CYAN|nr:glycosyltransferase family 39 protein [Romeriopsis navalis]MBE9028862.1 glycosyltransferase family 39 protein [Romeriopsis navalis LEGE 11480]
MPTFVRQRSVIFVVLIASVTIGIVLRFVNLDTMIYWGDEVYSSIRIFGYTTQEIYQTVAHGQPIPATVLQQFQQVGRHHNLGDTIRTLAIEDAHITPLYFLVARLWAMLFGSSISSIRSLSALFGVALLPAVYWLGIELFKQRRIALCSTALVAIAPVQLLYAQEARMYELWVLLIVITGATLLRAIRRPSWRSWGGFSLMLSASLYSHFLAAIPLAGYGLYTVVLHYRNRPILKRFLLSSTIGILSFCPWIWVFLMRQVVEQEDGTQKPFSLIEAVKNWFSLFRRLFIDVNTTVSGSSLIAAIALVVISGFCLAIVDLAIYRLRQETPMAVWLFIGLLIFGLPMSLFGESLHGVLPSRYLLPSYVGLQLAIGYLIGSRLTHNNAVRRWIWSSSLVALVTIGLISCASNVQANTWWNKGFSECNPATAAIINQSPRPLVISDGTGGPFFDHGLSNIISLARLVKPTTQFQVTLEPNYLDLDQGNFSDRFIFTPSDNLRQWLVSQYGKNMSPVLKLTHPYRGSDICLWRLSDAGFALANDAAATNSRRDAVPSHPQSPN